MLKDFLLKIFLVNPNHVVGAFLALAAIGLTAGGLFEFYKSYKAVASGETTTLTCISVDTKIDSGEGGSKAIERFTLNLEYEPGKFQILSFRNFFFFPVKKGDKVEVVYHYYLHNVKYRDKVELVEERAVAAFPKRFSSLWLRPMLFSVFGLLFGFGFYRFAKRT